MTQHRKFFGAVAWGLVLGLTAWTGVARADDGDENGPDRKVVRRHVVIVDKDGKEKVYEGDGPMMRRGYLGVGLTELTPELRAHFGVPGIRAPWSPGWSPGARRTRPASRWGTS